MASITLRCTAAALVLLLSQAVQADDDAHDKLVYSRYRRTLQPTAYKLDRHKEQCQLDRPATKKDVEAGDAIFSFEGLGEARVWKLPGEEFGERFPVNGQWPALNTPDRIGNGEVYQAEELNVDGKWKRYFGFVNSKEGAVVPAEEIELQLFRPPWKPDKRFFAGGSWGITVPGPKPGFWKRQTDERPKVGDPLPVELYVRPPGGDPLLLPAAGYKAADQGRAPLSLPATWYKAAGQGGPAPLDVVTLSLRWAPFDPTCPVRHDFVDMEPIRHARFRADGQKIAVNPGDPFRLFSLDLRDWFKVTQQGYYQIAVQVDCRALELRGAKKDRLECSRIFTIGKPPKPPTIAEFNKTCLAFGGPANEQRLRRVIKETVVPKPGAQKPLPAEIASQLAWSESVDGLAARIEAIWGSYDDGIIVLARFKNVSKRPIVVPTGNPRDEKALRPLEICVRQGTGSWRLAKPDRDRYCERAAPEAGDKPAYRTEEVFGEQTDRPTVDLKPGEHCLAYVSACDKEDNGQDKIFKVVLRRLQQGRQGDWNGVLETPPHPGQCGQSPSDALAGRLPMPEHFPTFTYAFTGINWGGSEPAFEALQDANRELLDVLAWYEPAGVRKEFERRMMAEKRLAMKLLLATVAARAGSEKAALFLMEMMKNTDEPVVINVQEALADLFKPLDHGAESPAWVIELAKTTLTDDRYATGLDEGQTARMCDEFSMEGVLCAAKCKDVMSLVLDRLKDGTSRFDTALMLVEAGEPRAVPRLLELAEAMAKKATYEEKYGLSDDFRLAAGHLAGLKLREAVPLLLRYVEYPDIIEALGNIGDARAVPALQRLVAARGKLTRDGEDVYPELEQKRLFAANVALAGFDRENGTDRLGEMLADQSMSVYQRGDVVTQLGDRHDPRAIPYLLKAIKTESRYQPAHMMQENRSFMIEMAIRGLGELKYKAAVEGLIDCFDVDFKEEAFGKAERATPVTYRNHIARSLQAITGQSFGADKQQWLKWWQEKSKRSAELK